jgi:hypothetical protein
MRTGDVTTTTTAETAVRLLLGVARLGEADLAGWWNSHGLDRAGRFVLARSFRRTWRSAALELDVRSAARRHDDALDSRRTALHLFSDELPFRRWAMSWLAEEKTADESSEFFDELAGWTFDDARRSLTAWAGQPPRGEAIGRGYRLGELSSPELDDSDLLLSTARLLTASYVALDGFRAPYFDLRA